MISETVLYVSGVKSSGKLDSKISISDFLPFENSTFTLIRSEFSTGAPFVIFVILISEFVIIGAL